MEILRDELIYAQHLAVDEDGRVLVWMGYASTARSRLEVVGHTGLTPLVGREPAIGLLRERWQQVKDGVGQVELAAGGSVRHRRLGPCRT